MDSPLDPHARKTQNIIVYEIHKLQINLLKNNKFMIRFTYPNFIKTAHVNR